jgi:hypothetical protein
MSPQDNDAAQTEPETETETETDSETKQQQVTPTESREQEVMSPVTKEHNKDQVKTFSTSVQLKSEEKRASVPILESERRQSRIQVKRKGSEGQARRDGNEEERRPDEMQSSDESGNEFVTLENKAGSSSRSASITTTNVIQVKARHM